MRKIITWVDSEGRYRVTSPDYDDLTRPPGETEDECIDRVWAKVSKRYDLPADQVFYHVEDADQRARLLEIVGTSFRYPPIADAEGRNDAKDGGAWEMDVDGRPKVNIAKARIIQMDHIRMVRDRELQRLDIDALRAVGTGDTAKGTAVEAEKQVLRDLPQTFDLSSYTTPVELAAAWPAELPEAT